MRHRLGRLFFTSLLRRLGRASLRVIITALIFAACLALASRYLGLPVPGLPELLYKFEGVSQLGEILS
jgi:hypothetical protein